MSVSENFKELVSELAASKREGQFWDFKKEHHKNKAELIHDVLCLANAKHSGDRFLIYGICPTDYAFVGITNGARSQADIVGIFSDNAKKFSSQKFPRFQLHELIIEGKKIDVLQIKDEPRKPFLLVEPIKQDGREVRAHFVYSRNEDRNTPMSQSALEHEQEAMWRERFGLDASPLEFFRLCLLDPKKSWKSFDDGIWHCQLHPELTYEFGSSESEPDEEWVRGEIGHYLDHGSWVSPIWLKYHNTKVFETRFVSFDGGKKKAIAPDWVPFGQGRLYYYQRDSTRYALHQHLSRIHGKDDSKSLRLGDHTISIPVATKEEIEMFQKKFPPAHGLPESDKETQNRLFLDALAEFDKLC